MQEGAVFSTLVVVFREALEAGLILGIILTVLARLGALRYQVHVWVSALVAVLLSLGVGFWLTHRLESTQVMTQAVIEIGISFVASGILTYMFFWMERQAKRIKSDIESHMEIALSRKDYWAIVSLPFFAVFREGAETVLFLKAVSIQNGTAVSWVGGVIGLVAAVLVTAAIFIGGKKVPLKLLFRVTGALVLLIAAGLLAYGVHEMNEIGWVPPVIDPVYNINHLLSDKEGLGSFLKALFGYNGNPSLTEILAYWLYLAAIAWGIRRTNTNKTS